MTTHARSAQPGDLCTCGRQATLVFASSEDGDVGWCGRYNVKPLTPCRFCGDPEAPHDFQRCPEYRLRPKVSS